MSDQISANVPGNAVDDGSSARATATHVGDPQKLGFSLVQAWLEAIWAMHQQMEDQQSLLLSLLILPFQQQQQNLFKNE